MKSTVGRALVAVLLLAGAAACWMAGQWQRRIAHADRALATFAQAQAEYDDVERSMRRVSGLPGLRTLASDVREHRAAMQYWRAQYDAVEVPLGAAGAMAGADPKLRFVAANAAYRQAQRDPQGLARRLDGVMKEYGEVMRLDPGHAEAAYNYEFVARERAALGGKHGAAATNPALPGPVFTIHGRAGAPPPGSDMTPFKMVVPLRPDERKDVPQDAGKGNPKKRKG